MELCSKVIVLIKILVVCTSNWQLQHMVRLAKLIFDFYFVRCLVLLNWFSNYKTNIKDFTDMTWNWNNN